MILKSAWRLSRFVIAVSVSCLYFNDAVFGQAQKRTGGPSAGSTTMVFVHVRDMNGRSLAGVRVVLDGPISGEFTTDVEGVIRLRSMRDGTYHLRFDRKGFSSQERELTIRGGQPDVVDITLSVGQPAPPPAFLPPADRPAVVPQRPPDPGGDVAAKPKAPTSVAPAVMSPPAASSAEQATTVSIPDFIDRHYIGRRRGSESVLGCTRSVTTRLLQMRDVVTEHVHTDDDETLYVIAGEGALLIPGRDPVSLTPGLLSILPRRTPHAIERRGKNPLILLSTLTGSPCTAVMTTAK